MQRIEQKCKKCRKKRQKYVKNYQTVEKTALKLESFWKKLQRSRGKSVNKLKNSLGQVRKTVRKSGKKC